MCSYTCVHVGSEVDMQCLSLLLSTLYIMWNPELMGWLANKLALTIPCLYSALITGGLPHLPAFMLVLGL